MVHGVIWSLTFGVSFLLLIYAFVLLRFGIAWRNIPEFKSHGPLQNLTIDVLIPYRNEGNHIKKLVEGLVNQSYKPENTRFYLINDHSGDGGADLARKLTQGDSRFVHIDMDAGQEGKKAALSKGLQSVRAHLIVFTDADCSHDRDWLHTMANFYGLHRPDLLLGPVAYRQTKHFLGKFCAFELTGLMGVTASSSHMGMPLLSNGANMMVRAGAITSIPDLFHRHYTSGDDVFLMHNLKKRGMKALYVKSREALVLTDAPGSIPSFFQQRARWASKNAGTRDLAMTMVSLTILALNAFMPAILIASIGNPLYLPAFLILFGCKTVIDLFFIFPLLKFFKHKGLLKFTPVFEAINFIYIPAVAMLAFCKGFEWKGRKYRK